MSSSVLIVGAGPVGLVAAHELARRDVQVRIIDKRPIPTDESRACAVHARSLDMFARMGIADELIAAGVKSVDMNMVAGGDTLMRVPFNRVDTAFPFCLVIPQTETERVLSEQLQALGVTVERSATLTTLHQDDDAVHVDVEYAGGDTEQISTPWLIGADGAHSTVRDLVEAEMKRESDNERFVLGDVVADHHLGDDHMYTFLASDGPVVVIPMGNNRIRIMPQVPATSDKPTAPTVEDLQSIIDERVGGITISDTHWLTSFDIRYGQVAQYRHQRVFLAGDAAHIHSPAGGQGMNTGTQDAFNLAWKLAAAVRGDGGQELLDSYHTERHPVARGVIRFTNLLTKVGTLDSGAAAARNVVMRAAGHIAPITHAMASNLSEANLRYNGNRIIVKAAPKHAKITAGQHLPYIDDQQLHEQLWTATSASNTGHTVLVIAPNGIAPTRAPLDQIQVLIASDDTCADRYDHHIVDKNRIIANRYGLRDGGRVIVRPDGYIGAVLSLHDHHGLDEYFARIMR
ncbi:2-polyprenyl-6-methoxyphenol hydroxylase-like oxidoreductase [Mycobacteroides abscessus subsp. abscessus]|uniref:FAD-dependent monooxygenase n=1 Tax=Mycobacteroides abscessus TaxID=36809 RepID=UPI000926BE40|nr:FAD-dependent monooxygenase [Mycobacteroides abscessus]MDM2349432.1 FAD-dependent monooxygenase [Mycobacteroides abscessus]MDM2357742.1 FAD-dependent monooxygenase [Mycobacteroides abscessus]SID40159.1 2-polyprenyl-6-methoxyphenol hydroxylase-like oxidoreductase [Mycobacteroides abscessus subsp. abscessus]SKU69600.1 2-polyprenyl-6-methoxyphenol hydroxylase-like oxidoreductase [Mycobacteroides abscessus subsp. abscessus]